MRVYWHEDGLGLPLTTPAGTMGAQLDSGADTTDPHKPGLALLTTDQIASAPERNAAIGAAGGFVTTKVRVLPRLDYDVDGVPLTALTLNISDSENGAGRIGSDMIVQLKLLTIDFKTMTLQAMPLR